MEADLAKRGQVKKWPENPGTSFFWGGFKVYPGTRCLGRLRHRDRARKTKKSEEADRNTCS